MNLTDEKDYLRLLPIEDLYELLEKLEKTKATKTTQYELVLEEIKGRK